MAKINKLPTFEEKIIKFRCYRCGHQWQPNDINRPPRVCPYCNSPYWITPKRKKEAKKSIFIK